MPVVLSQVDNDGHQHRECLLLVGLQDVEEVVVLKVAHGTIGDLKVNTANTLNDPLE